MKTLLHIPHASVYIPEDCIKDFCITPDELRSELLRMTDWYTDELYAVANSNIANIKAEVSRLVVDVERYRDDAHEEMSRVGMGAVYTSGSYLQPLKIISPERREELLNRFYDTHHQTFTQHVTDIRSNNGSCLIVDCHSFQTKVRMYEVDTKRKRPQICIGTDSKHTPQLLVSLVSDWATAHGYLVEVNEPYAGAIVPATHLNDTQVYSIMLEVRRDVYMDEETGAKNNHFPILQAQISELLNTLASAEI